MISMISKPHQHQIHRITVDKNAEIDNSNEFSPVRKKIKGNKDKDLNGDDLYIKDVAHVDVYPQEGQNPVVDTDQVHHIPYTIHHMS
jgi:hypothetical protein